MFKPLAPCSQPKNVIAKRRRNQCRVFFCRAYYNLWSLLHCQEAQWQECERTRNATSVVTSDCWSSQIYHRHKRCWWWWWHCTGRVPLLIYCLRQSNHGWRPPRWAARDTLYYISPSRQQRNTVKLCTTSPTWAQQRHAPACQRPKIQTSSLRALKEKMIFLSHIAFLTIFTYYQGQIDAFNKSINTL